MPLAAFATGDAVDLIILAARVDPNWLHTQGVEEVVPDPDVYDIKNRKKWFTRPRHREPGMGTPAGTIVGSLRTLVRAQTLRSRSVPRTMNRCSLPIESYRTMTVIFCSAAPQGVWRRMVTVSFRLNPGPSDRDELRLSLSATERSTPAIVV